VPDGQDGRVWSFQNFKAWSIPRALTVPQVFSFFPNTLMLPEE